MFFVFAPKVFAYNLVNIPVTIRDNDRDFQATLIATLQSSTFPQEIEGSQASHAGFNTYLGGIINNITDTTQPLAPSTIFDFSLPTSPTSNGLVEMFDFANIDALTIFGVTYIPSQIIASNPSFQNLVLAAIIAEPAGINIVLQTLPSQGLLVAQFQGVENLYLNPVTPFFDLSDVKVADIDQDGKPEAIFIVDGNINALRPNGTQLPGFPVSQLSISGTQHMFGLAIGDMNPSPGLEIVVGYYPQGSQAGSYAVANFVVLSSTGSTLWSVPNIPFSSLYFNTPFNIAITDQYRFPSLADINFDGFDDLISLGTLGSVSTGASNFVISVLDGLNGSNLSGSPATIPLPSSYNPFYLNNGGTGILAVGNVDNDSGLEAVFSIQPSSPYIPQTLVSGQVFVFDLNSMTVQNTFSFPVTNSFYSVNLPNLTLFNADNDPALELAIFEGVNSNALTVYNYDGSYAINPINVPGFLSSVLTRASDLIVGNFNGPPNLIFGFPTTLTTPPPASFSLNLYQNSGSSAPGFPISFGPSPTLAGRLASRARVADVNSDGVSDIIFPFEGGGQFYQASLYYINGINGLVIASTNLPSGAALISGPAIGDLDGDGVLEAVYIYSLPSSNNRFIVIDKVASYRGGVLGNGYITSGNVNSKNTNVVQ